MGDRKGHPNFENCPYVEALGRFRRLDLLLASANREAWLAEHGVSARPRSAVPAWNLVRMLASLSSGSITLKTSCAWCSVADLSRCLQPCFETIETP